MKNRPPQLTDGVLLPILRKAADSGMYLDTFHQRVENPGRPDHDVTRLEIEQVLRNGRRDHSRDKFEPYNTWSYVIEGKTLDGRHLRVVVALDPNGIPVIVSAYALRKRGGKESTR